VSRLIDYSNVLLRIITELMRILQKQDFLGKGAFTNDVSTLAGGGGWIDEKYPNMLRFLE